MKAGRFWGLVMALCLLCASAQAQPVRPGMRPRAQSLELIMNAGFVFPSSLSSCDAGIENPKDSGVWLRYTLLVEAQELELKTGVRPASAQPLVLFEGGPLAPGQRIDRFGLNALADGSMLAAGEYRAFMKVSVQDVQGDPVLGGEFAFEVFVRVMATQAEAELGPGRGLELPVFNPEARTARYAIVARADALNRLGGTVARQSGQSDFVALAMSDLLATGQGATLEIEGQALSMLPKAVCEAWLLRIEEGAVTAPTRLMIPLPGGIGLREMLGELPITQVEIEQAVVNTAYLLGLE